MIEPTKLQLYLHNYRDEICIFACSQLYPNIKMNFLKRTNFLTISYCTRSSPNVRFPFISKH